MSLAGGATDEVLHSSPAVAEGLSRLACLDLGSLTSDVQLLSSSASDDKAILDERAVSGDAAIGATTTEDELIEVAALDAIVDGGNIDEEVAAATEAATSEEGLNEGVVGEAITDKHELIAVAATDAMTAGDEDDDELNEGASQPT